MTRINRRANTRKTGHNRQHIISRAQRMKRIFTAMFSAGTGARCISCSSCDSPVSDR